MIQFSINNEASYETLSLASDAKSISPKYSS